MRNNKSLKPPPGHSLSKILTLKLVVYPSCFTRFYHHPRVVVWDFLNHQEYFTNLCEHDMPPLRSWDSKGKKVYTRLVTCSGYVWKLRENSSQKIHQCLGFCKENTGGFCQSFLIFRHLWYSNLLAGSEIDIFKQIHFQSPATSWLMIVSLESWDLLILFETVVTHFHLSNIFQRGNSGRKVRKTWKLSVLHHACATSPSSDCLWQPEESTCPDRNSQSFL